MKNVIFIIIISTVKIVIFFYYDYSHDNYFSNNALWLALAFFPSPTTIFSFFLPSVGGLLVEFWWCF